MCLGGGTKVINPPPPLPPVEPPPPPPPVTVTAPPAVTPIEPEKKRQKFATTKARQRRTALGGVTGKRKFTIPLGGYSASGGVSGGSTSGVNA